MPKDGPTVTTMTEGSASTPTRVEVELDIFSGRPNPTWVLTNAEADSFTKQLAALSPTSAAELSGNLGYRGFIIKYAQGAETQTIRLQHGIVIISKGVTNVYVYDQDRVLERWLLTTGRPHLKIDIFQIVERDFP
jgi:hypothetical protein